MEKTCPTCGKEYSAERKYCAKDGAELIDAVPAPEVPLARGGHQQVAPGSRTGTSPAGTVCPACRRSYPETARFCAVDGEQLVAAATAPAAGPRQPALPRPGSMVEKRPLPANAESLPTPPLVCFTIDPLPDFLGDHTLLSKEPQDRIREHCARWTQFISSLWRWHGRASFCLRYVGAAVTGETHLFLLAAPHEASDHAELGNDLDILLRSHGILALDQAGRPSGDRIDPLTPPPSPFFLELSQYTSRNLWNGRLAFPLGSEVPQWVQPDDLDRPAVTFPWWGPGGPFLLPMEALVSQHRRCDLSIYMEPTELDAREAEWLRLLAAAAESAGEQTSKEQTSDSSRRQADPAASLAGRLYIANFRRLSHPFLVAVHCAADGSDPVAAHTLASTIQALVHEMPFTRPFQDDDQLPSGSAIRSDDQGGCLDQYQNLRFAGRPEPGVNPNLVRLPHLVDAQGAATVFRLPVSVRGGVPGIPVRQRPPDFEPGSRSSQCPEGHIRLGALYQGGAYTVDKAQFTKHCLVTGFTGSGKTVTVLSLLHQFTALRIPFLVIESAKKEYRGLLGVELFRSRRETNPLRVYTVGDELHAPLRLNPFELLPGVRVEAHIGRLQTCFEGALPPIGPLASMIYEALLDIYRSCGWRLTDVGPAKGEIMRKQFPAMRGFARRMAELVDERGYLGEVRGNLTAAISGRVKPLTIGSRGRLFEDTGYARLGEPRPEPAIRELLENPTVLELNDLNLEDKALVAMFLLTLLREYRESCPGERGQLAHITVVEEAHNVLQEVGSTQSAEAGTADTRHKAVEAFCSMLTEIRALGEGLIIADQSPEKLARDAMRNTNVQIAHQLRDGHDREAVANAMIMDDEQQDYLGKLVPGQAALFVTGLQKATFITVPPYYPPNRREEKKRPKREGGPEGWQEWLKQYPGDGFGWVDGVPGGRAIDDAYVREYMDPWTGGYRRGDQHFGFCSHCTENRSCPYRGDVVRHALTEADKLLWLSMNGKSKQTPAPSPEEACRQMAVHALDVADRMKLPRSPDTALCVLAHIWDRCCRQTTDRMAYDPQASALPRRLLDEFLAAAQNAAANRALAPGNGPGPSSAVP